MDEDAQSGQKALSGTRMEQVNGNDPVKALTIADIDKVCTQLT